MSSDLSISPRIEAMRWVEKLGAEIARYRFNFSTEKELQAGLKRVFERLSPTVISEYRMTEKDIPDFYFPDQKVAVEVKIDHSLSDLTRQIHRYVQHDDILAILVVTPKTRLTNLPESINHKPVACVSLLGSVL